MSVLVPSPTPYPGPAPTPASTSATSCGVGVIRLARMNEARSSAAPYDKEEKGEKGEKRAAESKVEQQPVKRACDQCHSRKVKCDGHEPCRRCAKVSVLCTYLNPPKPRGAPPKPRPPRRSLAVDASDEAGPSQPFPLTVPPYNPGHTSSYIPPVTGPLSSSSTLASGQALTHREVLLVPATLAPAAPQSLATGRHVDLPQLPSATSSTTPGQFTTLPSSLPLDVPQSSSSLDEFLAWDFDPIAGPSTGSTQPESQISPEEWAEALDIVSSWDQNQSSGGDEAGPSGWVDGGNVSTLPTVPMAPTTSISTGTGKSTSLNITAGENTSSSSSSWLDTLGQKSPGSSAALLGAPLPSLGSSGVMLSRPPLSVQSFSQESNDVLPRLLAWQGNPPPSTFSSASSFSFLSGLGRSPHPSTSSVGFAPPDEICPLLTLTLDSLIRPQLNVFFERVYPMIPVFARDEVLLRLNSTGLRDRDFIAMILSMTALSLVHPLNASEELQRPTRARQATMLLDEACRLSARWDYGCAASTESVLTSYLMFGTLFELGHASGARMRLRESISMGEAMRLDDPEAYAGLDSNEARRRMRMYWILAVTERAYALQRSGHVVFEGSIHTSHHRGTLLGSSASTEEDPTSALLRHLAHIFSFVDQDVIACWNGRCDRLTCRTLTAARAVDVLSRLKGSPAEVFGGENELRGLSESQKADLLVTWQWIRSRIWRLAAQHGLTREGADGALSADYVVDVANTTVAICRRLSHDAMEAHGAGFVEKIVDIANMISSLIRSAFTSQTTTAQSEQSGQSGQSGHAGDFLPTPPLSAEKLAHWVGLLQSLHYFASGHRARNVQQMERLAGEVASSMGRLMLLGNEERGERAGTELGSGMGIVLGTGG